MSLLTSILCQWAFNIASVESPKHVTAHVHSADCTWWKQCRSRLLNNSVIEISLCSKVVSRYCNCLHAQQQHHLLTVDYQQSASKKPVISLLILAYLALQSFTLHHFRKHSATANYFTLESSMSKGAMPPEIVCWLVA